MIDHNKLTKAYKNTDGNSEFHISKLNPWKLAFWKETIIAEDEVKASVILAKAKPSVKAKCQSQVFHHSDLLVFCPLYTVQKHLPEVFYEERYSSKISQNLQKNTYAGVFFNKVDGLRPATLLKKKLWHTRFPMNFVKILRTPLNGCFRR